MATKTLRLTSTRTTFQCITVWVQTASNKLRLTPTWTSLQHIFWLVHSEALEKDHVSLSQLFQDGKECDKKPPIFPPFISLVVAKSGSFDCSDVVRTRLFLSCALLHFGSGWIGHSQCLHSLIWLNTFLRCFPRLPSTPKPKFSAKLFPFNLLSESAHSPCCLESTQNTLQPFSSNAWSVWAAYAMDTPMSSSRPKDHYGVLMQCRCRQSWWSCFVSVYHRSQIQRESTIMVRGYLIFSTPGP